jgi:MFS family permease
MNGPLTVPLSANPREDWLRAGVLAGFLGTFALTVVLATGYFVANGIGDPAGNMLQRWSWALVHNPLTERTEDAVILAIGANLAVGLVFALIYARFVEPLLGGRGAWKGMRFALVPWLLSLAVFFPLIGAGLFGLGIGAGPLPILGNLILHLVYGAVLGVVYAEGAPDLLESSEFDRTNAAAAERGAAAGVVAGLVVGGILGWVMAPALGTLAGPALTSLGGALIGAAVGLAVGSFVGMGRVQPR